MKRIVIATDSYLPRWDGVARFLSEIIPRLKNKFKVTVIAPNFGPHREQGIKTVKIALKKIHLGDIKPAKFDYKRIKEEVKNADVVFTQTIGFIGLAAIIAAKRFKKPLVTFIHSVEWELFPKAISSKFLKQISYPIVKFISKKIYNQCSLLIVPSTSIAEKLSWQGIRTKKSITHLGVDVNKFKNKRDDSFRKKLGIEPDDFIIGYHGRLGREKDLKTLLRAFIRLKIEHKRVKLLVVGDGVKEIVRMFKKQDRIILPGSQNNIVPYINAMDVYVLPSLTETTSLTTLEAMACELPVIATKVGFVNDYLDDEKNGFFFKMQNPYDLKKKIEFVMNNPNIRKKIGQEARKTVVEKFNWQIAAERIEEAILSVVE
ncbi:MAG: glycosyltransferase family 4 protein [Nanoarchaeota archaeon]|nr:glycosyltransferase family 4 protein [Nanoarchaeota archaeon]MBU1030651.1 glycosyltransferase family 4 protein [Nanoarchaeota archaeon]MBU1849853.1 glycosyltransferase family 4 protein [Nanoarchaeota archaeon]